MTRESFLGPCRFFLKPSIEAEKIETTFLHREQPDGAHCSQKPEGSSDENEAGGAVVDEFHSFMTVEGGVEQLFFV